MTNPYKGQTADYRLDGTDAGSTVAAADRGASPSADESETNRTPPANVYSPPGFVDGSDSEDETGDKAAPPEDPSPSHSHLDCRCGAQGPDGSIFTVDDPAIQCDRCKDWSHVSCQRDGRAYKNKPSDLFECDYCIQNGVLPDLHMDALDGLQQVRTSKRLHILLFSMGNRGTLASRKPIRDRIGPGKGVLVKNGKYYYPARLIRCILHSKLRTYAVKWWRECKFHRSAVLGKPGEISVVPEAAVVDDLYFNRELLQLGQWTHACEVLSAEDILADPGAVPYQKEIEAVLVPHCTTLRDLLTSPETFDILDIPALQNLSHANGSMGPRGAEAGDLSVLDQAQVMNWFERHVANGDKAVRSMWRSLNLARRAWRAWLAAWRDLCSLNTHPFHCEPFTAFGEEVLSHSWLNITTSQLPVSHEINSKLVRRAWQNGLPRLAEFEIGCTGLDDLACGGA
ncbi:hypothetical protein DFH09DRAFT_1109731 [Mycena vulgaris]|nr:hypothetical protein DFH09DRAFT_1109731 [Mycena vulgaris]